MTASVAEAILHEIHRDGFSVGEHRFANVVTGEIGDQGHARETDRAGARRADGRVCGHADVRMSACASMMRRLTRDGQRGLVNQQARPRFIQKARIMWRIFSKRNARPPDVLNYEISQTARRRIAVLFVPNLAGGHGQEMYHHILELVYIWLLQEYGQLCIDTGDIEQHSSQHSQALLHFLQCPSDQALDFIEMYFVRARTYVITARPERINLVFREEGIGYEVLENGEIIRKGDEATHEEIVRPCLAVLANPVFKIANAELLGAFRHIRKSDLRDALTSCGSAYESVLKTICTHQKWAFKSDDAARTLVGICQKKGLFHGFYAETMTAPAMIRNRLSTAHGKGPDGSFSVSDEHINHMIHLTCANILFLVKSAKM